MKVLEKFSDFLGKFMAIVVLVIAALAFALSKIFGLDTALMARVISAVEDNRDSGRGEHVHLDCTGRQGIPNVMELPH